MDRRLSRRKLALSTVALWLFVPTASACGFDYATDRENTVANGVSDQDGQVDVLNAMIVSGETGSGTFIASLANNDPTEPISLESIDSGSDAGLQFAEFDPVEVPPHGLVNLSDGQGVKVSGEFEAGDFVDLTVTFDNGESASMEVHVVAEDDEYAGLDNGTGAPSPATSELAS